MYNMPHLKIDQHHINIEGSPSNEGALERQGHVDPRVASYEEAACQASYDEEAQGRTSEQGVLHTPAQGVLHTPIQEVLEHPAGHLP